MRLHLLAVPQDTTAKPGMEFPVDESPGGSCGRPRQPFIVNDIGARKPFPRCNRPLLRENGVQSYCVVPVTTALGRLGAMGFGSVQKRVYRSTKSRSCRKWPNRWRWPSTTSCMPKARTPLRRCARERDRFRLLLEVNNAVVSHLDMDAVFTSVSTSLQRVVQHDGCSLLLFEPDTGHYRCHVLKVTGTKAL